MKRILFLIFLLSFCNAVFGQVLLSNAKLVNMSTAVISTGGGGGFDPSSDTQKAAWYDASVLSYPDNTSMSNWPARFGSDATNGATATTGRPRFLANFQNGLGVTAWTNTAATSMHLTNITPFTVTQPYEVWITFQFTATNQTTQDLVDGVSASDRFVIQTTSTSSRLIFSSPTGVTTTVPSDTSWHTMGILLNGASSAYSVDGAAPTTASAGTGNWVGLTIGNRFDFTTSQRFNIGEILVRTNTDGTSSFTSKYNYFKTKWGTP